MRMGFSHDHAVVDDGEYVRLAERGVMPGG